MLLLEIFITVEDIIYLIYKDKNLLVIEPSKIITMNQRQPIAGYLEIKEGKIIEIGGLGEKADSHEHMDGIDSRCGTLLPGFIDAHMHFHALAESMVNFDASSSGGIYSINDLVQKIRITARNTPPGEWIRAGGYNEFNLEEKRHPTRKDLDKATTTHPIKLTHRSGHAHVLNTLGLKNAGIDRYAPEPLGGYFDRDLTTGDPNGLLFGCQELLTGVIPPLSEHHIRSGVAEAGLRLSAAGITSFHDASYRNDDRQQKRFEKWIKEGLVKAYPILMTGWPFFYRADSKLCHATEGRGIAYRGVKIMITEATGKLHPAQKALNAMLHDVQDAGCFAAIHAVDIKPIESALIALESVSKEQQHGARSTAHRLEHAFILSPAQAALTAKLDIIVVTQPGFLYDHGDRYLAEVSEADKPYLYPIGRMKEAGICVAAGSDAPMGPLNPLVGIHAAVTRLTNSARVIGESERIDVIEALKMYTIDAARAVGIEDKTGSIEVGKRADLVVLSEDPTTCPPEKLKDICVLMTISKGEIIYRADSLSGNNPFFN